MVTYLIVFAAIVGILLIVGLVTMFLGCFLSVFLFKKDSLEDSIMTAWLTACVGVASCLVYIFVSNGHLC